MKKRTIDFFDPEFLITVISAYLASLGLCLFTFEMVGMSYRFPVALTLTACIAAMALSIAVAVKPRILLGAAAVIVIPVILLLLFTDLWIWLSETSAKFFVWLQQFLSGNAPAGRADFESFMYVIFLLLITVLCYVCFVFLRSMLLSFAIVVMPILSLQIFVREDLPLIWLIPSVIGLTLMMMITSDMPLFSRKDREKSRTGFLQSISFVMVLILAGLASIVFLSSYVPASQLRSDDVADMTDDTLSFLNIPLPESGNRKTFNLGSIGFYPLHDRLGGPVTINNDDVMLVTASDDLLLKAITYNVYAQHYWSSNNYMFSTRFDSALLRNQQVDFFDSARPPKELIPAALYASVLEQSTVRITTQSDITGGTLFTPEHLLNIRVPDKTPYYNQSGEVYLRNGVDEGQAYEIDFIRFRTESPSYFEDLLQLEAYLAEHPEIRDPESKIFEIRESNLTANVPFSVKDKAFEITADATTPLEKVLALREYLLTEFTYSLDVEIPPNDMDFVEHFLATKKGYCTYFASAMTMMARSVDIPAHYVEGFVVNVPDDADEVTVTVAGRHAHAWCEVYIDGIGWVPIDATAAAGGDGLSFSEDLGEWSESTYGDSVDEDAEQHIPFHQEDNTSPDVSGPLYQREQSRSSIVIILIAIVIVVLLLSALFLMWRKWTRFFSLSEKNAQKTQTTGARITWIWKRILRYLSLMAVSISASETPRDFAKRITEIPVYLVGCHKDTYCFDVTAVSDLYECYLYGGKDPSTEEIELAAVCLNKLAGQVKAAHVSPFLFILRLLFIRQDKNI